MGKMTRAEAEAVINASDPTGETDAAIRDAHLSDAEVIEEAEAIGWQIEIWMYDGPNPADFTTDQWKAMERAAMESVGITPIAWIDHGKYAVKLTDEQEQRARKNREREYGTTERVRNNDGDWRIDIPMQAASERDK